MPNLADELARVEAELERLTIVRAHLAERVGGDLPKRGGPARPRQSGGGNGRVTAAAAALEVLAEHGQMRTPDLLKAVRAKGATISTADNLYKTLTRSPAFRKVGRGVWTLAS